MKPVMRKPLLPLLLLTFFVFQLCFVGLLRQTIARDERIISDMYDKTTVTYQVLPGANAAGVLSFRPHAAERLERMDAFDGSFYYLICPYTLRVPASELDLGCFYGTNKPEQFLQEQGLTVSYADRFDANDWQGNSEQIPCIVQADFAEKYGLTLSDRFTAAPYDGTEADDPKAPDARMKIVGIFDAPNGDVSQNAIILPDNVFLEEPTLFYNWRVLGSFCAYREYAFRVKPEYNSSLPELEQQINTLLYDQDVTVHSDARVMKKAIRPIEQRLRIQKTIQTPLEIIFAIIPALLSLLFALSLQEDVFLKRLWGESSCRTFFAIMGKIVLVLLIAAGIAFGIGVIVLERRMLPWTGHYLGITLMLSSLAAAIPTAVSSRKNLVRFYQTKEGYDG